jgi:hypothetical protein
MRTVAAAIVVAVLLPAASQPDIGQDAATNIPVEEWTAMASGRTLTYRINGEFWALEHYYPGSNHVTLQLYDGTCMEGTWDYTAPLYCFHWEGQGTSCFRHARRGDEILIIETRDGADTPMTQMMTAVTDVPLTCGPAVTS